MMLTIHGLPVMVKYHDLKTLIKQECNINDFILDNLTADVDGSKKVRIGVADEAEGAHLCKCLNGFRMGGNLLRVLPVGKASVNQNTFDQRGGFMPRNDMPNQHGNFGNQPANFGNQFSNQTQHAQATWNTGSQSSQWGSNQQPQNQMRQANFDFQQRTGPQFPMQQTAPVGQQGPGNKPFGQSGPFIQNRTGPPEQGFGFAQPNKPQPAPQMRSDRSHVLRSVDIVQGPVHPNRYSDQKYDQNKPGPSQFDTPQQNYPQAGLIQAVPWSKLQAKNLTFGKPDVPQFESDKRHMPKNFEKGPLIHGQHERRLSPQDRRPSPHRRPSPGGPIRPPDRRLSPGRRVSPGRRMSPGRRVSPGRRMSPTGRRMSPGRRVSPNDRRAPVRKSPGRVSPHKRSSPGRRLVSPGRDNLRYSPSRRHDKSDFSDSRGPKQIRPAYEADAKAPNQAMYSDGYRPNLHENVSYPSRQTDQRSSSWQDRDKNTYPGSKKQDEDRRMVRGTEPEAKRSPIHKSRSPNRRDVRERSPLRDRYRRHSPSPRSPRRSWALEKRRSPEISEAPPPPVWPGQNPEDHYTRPTSKTQEGAKPVPVWDHRTFQETEASMRRENRLYDEEQMRMRRDAGRRDAIPPSNRREPSPRRPGFKPHEDMNRDTKFEPRDSKFESRDPKYDPREPKFDTRDPKFNSRDPKFNSRDPKFETREHKFETHVSRFDLRDSKFDQRDPKFEPRDPKFEPRDPNFQPRDPMFEPRDPKFEPRDPKFEPRDPKFIPRDPKFEPREPKFEPRDPKFEPREPKFEPRDPKFEPRDPKFEPRGPEYRPRDPKFEPHDPKFGPRGPKFERDNKYDSRDPKFDQRNPKFEMREPKFEARNTKYDPREPKFEPRDPKFNPREPKFEPRDPKFESRDPKFEPRGNEFRSSFDHTGDKRQPPNYEPRDEPKFGSRDTFGSRNTKFEQRDQKFKPTFEPVEADFTQQELDFGTRDSKFEPRESKYGARESKFDRNDHRRTLESPERKSYLDRDDFRSKRPEPSRDNTSRREEPNRRDERKDIRKPHDQFDLEFEDIYKRTREFKQKVEELKRAERNREEREPSRDQRRRDTDEDGRHSDRKTEGERRHQEDRPHSRQSSDKREPEWKPRNIIPRKIFLPSVVKAKRDKAVDEIANKLMHKYGDFEMTEEIKNRVLDELKLSIARIMYDMFGNEDISFIELVVKFNSKHGEREEVKIFEDVMSCFPKHHRAMKRPAQETDKSDIPEKSSRLATDTQSEQDSRRFARSVRKPVITKKPVLRAAAISKPKLERPKRLVPHLSVKPNADGLYELDATTSRLLEDDLQKIMIKVWQALPDDAPTEEEKMVIEKFRNKASDDLKNALGLNVTKRLLNIFNPLNVKVHFSTKPERKYLKYFLKQYNFVAFKRIVGIMNTFAAQVKTIEDYDNLCNDKNIFCGAAKITITPCYRLIQCPKNIKTIYGSPEDDNPTKNKEITKQGSEESSLKNDEAKELNTAKTEQQAKSKIIDEESKESINNKKLKSVSTAATVTSAKENLNQNIKTAPTVCAKPNVQKSNVSTEVKSTNNTENKTPNVPVTKSTENAQNQNTTIEKTNKFAIDPKTNDDKNPKIATKTNTSNSKIDVITTSGDSDNKTVPTNKKDNKTTIAIKNADTKAAGNATATVAKTTTTVKPATTEITSSETTTTTKTTTTVKPANTKIASNETTTATKTTIPVKAATTKIASTETTTATQTTIPVKPVNIKIASNESTTSTKTTTPVKPANTKVITTTTVSSNVKADITKIVKKNTATTINAKPTEVKIATNIKTNKVVEAKKITNTTKNNVTCSKQTNKKSNMINVKKQTDTKLSSKDDDFEELDDHELYQYLMSTGIVLDECSGSDDD
ncbi:unnamed protein product [Diatraea saccharalis]|uniref:Uncharacterized protein n=1 Tax=Diatraea saccharalis TaxID=40085 RepID=A0A9P0CBG6_9NEOP|nr:unnamed protein product [Diatraea saccharalis]